MTVQNVVKWIESKYSDMVAGLDERSRRLWCAVEARSLGYGGIATVAEATGVSERTIHRGLEELRYGSKAGFGRQRRAGGGRKPIEKSQPGVQAAIAKLIGPSTRGDPMGPLLWTCKSTRVLADELGRLGFTITAPTVGQVLKAAGYSLQSNRKTREGEDHPDRNAQFEHINRRAVAFQRSGQPVVSVDTKKKEILGNKKNSGQTWRPSRQPLEVDTHDFPDPTKGKAVPYGVYDVTTNEAVVNATLRSVPGSALQHYALLRSRTRPAARRLESGVQKVESRGDRMNHLIPPQENAKNTRWIRSFATFAPLRGYRASHARDMSGNTRTVLGIHRCG